MSSVWVVIFAMVSTNLQKYDRQINEFITNASSKGWGIDAVFAEKITVAKNNSDRTQLISFAASNDGGWVDVDWWRVEK